MDEISSGYRSHDFSTGEEDDLFGADAPALITTLPGQTPVAGHPGQFTSHPGRGRPADYGVLATTHWYDYFNPLFWFDHATWAAQHVDVDHRAAALAAVAAQHASDPHSDPNASPHATGAPRIGDDMGWGPPPPPPEMYEHRRWNRGRPAAPYGYGQPQPPARYGAPISYVGQQAPPLAPIGNWNPQLAAQMAAQNPALAAQINSMNSWQRWQQVHPGTPYADYQGWFAQYGAAGGQIN